MKTNEENTSTKGLSLSQTIALILILVAVFICIGGIFHREKTKNVNPVIVVTEETQKTYYQSEDLIGDFILNNEYFLADAEISNVEVSYETEEKISTPLEQNTDKNDNTENDVNNEEVISDVMVPETPMIAIVIDDMGINRKRTLDIISIKAPLTSSFLTYGNDLSGLVDKAKASGHEIMIHAPMEPKKANNLAPDTLKTDMNKEQIETMFMQMLKKFNNIEVKGINNHMGSKFTEDEEKLSYIMDILKQHNMFFLDSKTSSISKGKNLPLKNEVKFVERDVFLDNKNDYDYILKQLQKTEEIAFKKGFAVAICHPKSQTYLALKDWVESLKDKQLKLVHISDIVQKTSNKNL